MAGYPFRDGSNEDVGLPVPREVYQTADEGHMNAEDEDYPQFEPEFADFGSDDEPPASRRTPNNLLRGIVNGFGSLADQVVRPPPQLRYPILPRAWQPSYLETWQAGPMVEYQPHVQMQAFPSSSFSTLAYPQFNPYNVRPTESPLRSHAPSYVGHFSQHDNSNSMRPCLPPSFEPFQQDFDTFTAPYPRQATPMLEEPPYYQPIYSTNVPALTSRPNGSSTLTCSIVPSSTPAQTVVDKPVFLPSSDRPLYAALPRSFRNSDEANAYRRRIREAPSEDETVARVEENKQFWVESLYEAMISVDLANDNPEKDQGKRLGTNHDFAAWFTRKFDQKDVEAACWNIVDHCLDLHKLGQRFDNKYNKSRAEDRKLNCEQRLEAMCMLLKTWKSACCEVMRERNVDHIVNQPMSSIRTKDANKSGNRTKAEALEVGRKILAETEKSKSPVGFTKVKRSTSLTLDTAPTVASAHLSTKPRCNAQMVQPSSNRPRACRTTKSASSLRRKRGVSDDDSDEDYAQGTKRRR